MYQELLSRRLAQLRIQKGVSARDMSLSMGQSDSYINKIENQRAMPSMQTFFYICDYLGVTPKEFFDDGDPCPVRLKALTEQMRALSEEQLQVISVLVQQLAHAK